MHSADLEAEAFLDALKVKDICKTRKITTLYSTDSIGKAMEV